MKKKLVYLLLGCLAFVLIPGCGKDKDQDGTDQPAVIEATITPSGEQSNIVNMQKITGTPSAANVLGTKTAASTELSIVNSTGKDITQIYIRTHVNDYGDDNWGEDLVKGAFTLNSAQKASYYYEAAQGVTYDIRVVYTGGEGDENYFRDLDFGSMKQITLYLTEDGIPYARYYDETQKKDYSTLSDVKARMGITDTTDTSLQNQQEQGEKDEEKDDTPEPTPTPAEEQPPVTPEPTTAPVQPPSNEDIRAKAQTYIGSSIDTLIADPDIGGPNSSKYETDPDLGQIGNYFYDTFTVTTSVDENGQEVVTNIW